jgi:predicted lipid-binding transport protein (Tim44 family)/uncharacterized membrane protein YgcG
MWFHADNVALDALQALAVALPAAGLPAWLLRHRRGAWALVLPGCVVVCVAVIALVPVSADVYAWAALLLVPPGCALALGWAMRGASAPLALLAAPLLAVAWIWPEAPAGEVSTDLLIVGSCVTLGRLITGAAPLTLVKVGLVAMAAVDAALVFSGALTEPAATLNAAQAAPGLPQLQTGVLQNSSLGYGDFLAAGVLGGILAAEDAPAGRWALAVLAVSMAWNQLFLVTDLLPATVPPALVLIAREGKNRPMLRRLAPLSALLTLLLCSSALASAGGGSSGFGGGGGGGFSGGGGSYSGGGGSASLGTGGTLAVFAIIGLIVLVVFVAGLISAAKLRRRRRERVARVTTASAEAAADDAAFAAETVTGQAAQLFLDVQTAWDARDRDRLRQLVGPDLMVEWERRLDDFERKGWHNRVHVNGRPTVEYVGMVNREDDADDRVVVRVEASTDDYVETRDGGRIMHDGQSSAATQITEYWTLDKRENDRWCLLSIEQDAEGVHHLDSEIVASPWGDSRVHDEAVAERAAADAAPAGVSPAELVDVDFAGPARAKAMDLSLADGRFDVDLIETSVRRAVEAWAEAVDGADTDLEAVARPEAVRALLGDADARTRVVIRGPKVEAVTITALDAEVTPATLTVELAVRARRYVEDRDTVALLSGSRDSESSFTEHWTLALDAEGEWPWRIAATTAATTA